MSKKELRQILKSNSEIDKAKKPAHIEEDMSHIGSLKTIRSVFQSPASNIATSMAIDMIEDVMTYIIQLQEIIKVFRHVNYMEDHGEGKNVKPEITEQYNKFMKYNHPLPPQTPLYKASEEMLSQEEIDTLLAPPTPDSASMPLTDYIRLGNESQEVTDEERVTTALILESFELEQLQHMLAHAGLSLEMGPQANEREILTGLISNNPHILERWLHAGSPRHE